MIVTAFALAAVLSDPSPPTRAAVCHAHVMLMIEDAMRESGRVAGPSWFVRDWWEERLSEAELEDAAQKALHDSLVARKAEAPDAFDAEQKSCVDEAIEAGALPGDD